MSENRLRFGDWLRARRLMLGLTQREYAGQSGVDFVWLSKVENNRLAPPYFVVEYLMRPIRQALSYEEGEIVEREALEALETTKRLGLDEHQISYPTACAKSCNDLAQWEEKLEAWDSMNRN